ncbi:hypothetical protein GJ25_gp094 [Mycobacterium phage Hawkeye]|uniref:Uncharacterized protein n=1 Tax=Mycobacterium phage Hawkeye TaxID=1458711 RepID=X2KT62_9CAUD|nr:hypothetical protein GJ25_gp094 [Mycobacterium phage Hawkeye]AHN84105.1 hypothetical protein PBI_HAWKEYE_94 [Mycobacterium phage Hawkeye]
MKTDSWYNWHFWLWDLRSYLCHWRIRKCPDCRRNERIVREGGYE